MRNTCMRMIYELAKNDQRVVLISSDQDVGLSHMQREMPNQYFLEGISEANIVGMASGLALDGYIPFVVSIASFLTRRCYEQIALDVCLENLPVRLVGIGAGLNYAHLGPTHQAIEDIAIMRALPNMTVIVPCDADEMTRLMPHTLKWPKPIYIRLARYGKPIVSKDAAGFEIGKAIVMRKADPSNNKVLLIATGAMIHRALSVAEELEADGINCAVLHVHTIKPLDCDTIVEQARDVRLVVTLEEHTVIGGLGSACIEALTDRLYRGNLPRIHRMGLPDRFIHDYGTQESLMEQFELQPPQIAKTIKILLAGNFEKN